MFRTLFSFSLLLLLVQANNRFGHRTRALGTDKSDESTPKGGKSASTTASSGTPKGGKSATTSTASSSSEDMPKGKGKGSAPAPAPAPAPSTGGKGKGSPTPAAPAPAPEEASMDASMDAEPAKASLCVTHVYKYLIMAANVTSNDVGEVVESFVLDAKTGEFVAYYQHSATYHESTDCDYHGMVGFDWDGEMYPSQLFLQGTCSGESDAITGGTGKYECATGTMTYDEPEGDEYGYVTTKLCGAGCSLYN
jgi:hypothetical protein